jgi:hypothetical protein
MYNISSKIKKMTHMSTISILLKIEWIISQSNKAREKNKRDENRKEKSQIILICKWHDAILKKS